MSALDIPAFITDAREGTASNTPRTPSDAPHVREWVPMVPMYTPPVGWEPVRLRLADEFTHVGSGVRLVHVKVGRKWTHVWSSATGYSRRIKKDRWLSLRKIAEIGAI